MNKMKLPSADLEFQMIRQPGQKAQDRASLRWCPMIEQLPIGGHSPVLPPEIPCPEFIFRAERVKTHLLMIAKEHGHIGRSHDPAQDIHAHHPAVNHISDDV